MLKQFAVLPLRIKITLLLVVGFSFYVFALLGVSLPRLASMQQESYESNLKDNLAAGKYVLDTFAHDSQQTSFRIVNSTQFLDNFKEQDPVLQSILVEGMMAKNIHHLGYVVWNIENGPSIWSRSHNVREISPEHQAQLTSFFGPMLRDEGGEPHKSYYKRIDRSLLKTELPKANYEEDELLLISVTPIFIWEKRRGFAVFATIINQSKDLEKKVNQILDLGDNPSLGIQINHKGVGYLKLGNRSLIPDTNQSSPDQVDTAQKNLDDSTQIMIYSDRHSLGQRIQGQVQLMTFLFVVISIIFLMIIIRLLLSAIDSLKDLVRTSSLMKSGNYQARMQVKRSDELGLLALRFNEMAESIETQVKQIEDQANKEKELRKLKYELELSQLKTQMRPHFLFNSLNTIASLIDIDQEAAAEVTMELATLYRMILESSESLTSPLNRELEIVRIYLKIQTRRFEDRLAFEILAPEERQSIYLPQLLLQTLVENAVKHGIDKNLRGGHIEVQIKKVNDHYQATISNTGTLQPGFKEGTGLKNTKKILDHLYGKEGHFKIHSPQPNIVEVNFDFSGDKQ